MGNYTDFLRQHSGPKARIRRLYWVYGEEPVFRDLVSQQIQAMWGAEPFNVLRLSAADTSEAEIWAALNQHPLDSEKKRLIVVTEAQKLQNLENLIDWVRDNQVVRAAKAVAVFVSNSPEWEEGPARDYISKSSSAAWVKCTLPKSEDEKLKRAQEAIRSWGDIDNTTAGVLAKRVNFDMGEAYAVMRKVALFPGAVATPRIVTMLAPRRVEEDIVWSLLSLNRRKAIEAVVEGRDSYSPSVIIGTLTTHVEMLGRLNKVLAYTTSPKEAAVKVEAKEQYVRRLYPYARLYPRKDVVRRTHLLARLDQSLKHGAQEGVMESLVALW